jgi:hypothetical protein
VIEEIRKESDAPVNAEEKSSEPKLLYEIKKLQGWFNPEASKIESLIPGRAMILGQADILIMML